MKITTETLYRAGRTFIQAMLAYIAVNFTLVDFTAERSIIRQTLIGLAVSALSAGISAVMNMKKPEQLGSGKGNMTFSEWVEKYIGKKTDYDGVYGVQCVDLIDCYVDQVLGLTKGFWGNAKYWWTNRNSNSWLKNNFSFITPKYKDKELKKGDIGIKTSGTYGHIFVIADVNNNGTFSFYDQNATGKGDKMALRTKPYNSSNINGILRPKDRSNIDKISVPSVAKCGCKVGAVITLTRVRGCYKGYGSVTGRKLVKNMTADGRKNCTTTSGKAYYKAGTKVTVKEIKKISSGNIWIKTPSCYICIYDNEYGKMFK